jgi:LmbE family N-acetylglucosaminyl deacetylase
VFATDGAPQDSYFWGKFGSRLRYQRVREEEARQALSPIGVSELHFLANEPLANGDCLVDQSLHRHLVDAYDRVASLIARSHPEAVLTLAYEGGHPDHDCCSFLATHLATQHSIPVWELPLYHSSPDGHIIYQSFLNDLADQKLLELSCEELLNKRSMLNSYASQYPFLFEFDASIERFRPQPAYEYSRPPHPGALNYEAWGWQVKGTDLCDAFRQFTESRVGISR